MNIEIYTFKDKQPKNGEHIFFIKDGLFARYIEHGKVEYTWDDGDGWQICYEDGDDCPEDGFELSIYICVDNSGSTHTMNDETIWWSSEEIFDKIAEKYGR